MNVSMPEPPQSVEPQHQAGRPAPVSMVEPPPTASTQPQVPPGWYPDGVGWRWWDGRAWGQPAPPTTDPNDRQLAIFSHLGFILGGFVVPLILYVISDDETRPETRHHAREALNFQLTFAIVNVAVTVLVAVGLAGVGGSGFVTQPADEPGELLVGFGLFFGWFFFVFGLILAMVLVTVVLSIVAAVKASKGEPHQYPLCIRFLRS